MLIKCIWQTVKIKHAMQIDHFTHYGLWWQMHTLTFLVTYWLEVLGVVYVCHVFTEWAWKRLNILLYHLCIYCLFVCFGFFFNLGFYLIKVNTFLKVIRNTLIIIEFVEMNVTTLLHDFSLRWWWFHHPRSVSCIMLRAFFWGSIFVNISSNVSAYWCIFLPSAIILGLKKCIF